MIKMNSYLVTNITIKSGVKDLLECTLQAATDHHRKRTPVKQKSGLT